MALEQVPKRMVIGQTREIKWTNVAPAIASMRKEARERFAQTGAKGNCELTTFYNITPEGADVTVGIEVADPKDFPALGEGFESSVVAAPGQYLRDDHPSGPSTLAWMGFMTRLAQAGYKMNEPLSMFEVYSGTGGREGVSMYVAVSREKN